MMLFWKMKMMKNKKENFIFWGTPDVASETLEILKTGGYTPSLIITSVDKPQGRKMVVTPSPVKLWAIENNIPYLQPEKLDNEFIGKLKKEINSKDITLSIVVAYGKILKEELINLPKLGTLNIHYSLLPKYRGASPLQSALLNGDTRTGITIQQMDFKLDSGPIIAQKEVSIDQNEEKDELERKLIELGAETLASILPNIFNKNINKTKQNEGGATYCTKIKKEDGLINLGSDGLANFNKYRAFSGWPGTYFFIKNKSNKKIRVKINKAKYENNSFTIERVTPEGKKEISFTDFEKNY